MKSNHHINSKKLTKISHWCANESVHHSRQGGIQQQQQQQQQQNQQPQHHRLVGNMDSQGGHQGETRSIVSIQWSGRFSHKSVGAGGDQNCHGNAVRNTVAKIKSFSICDVGAGLGGTLFSSFDG
jgi:hypothetical protein